MIRNSRSISPQIGMYQSSPMSKSQGSLFRAKGRCERDSDQVQQTNNNADQLTKTDPKKYTVSRKIALEIAMRYIKQQINTNQMCTVVFGGPKPANLFSRS